MFYSTSSIISASAATAEADDAIRRNGDALSKLPTADGVYLVFARRDATREGFEGKINHSSAETLARAGGGRAVRSMMPDYSDPNRKWIPTGDGVAWIPLDKVLATISDPRPYTRAMMLANLPDPRVLPVLIDSIVVAPRVRFIVYGELADVFTNNFNLRGGGQSPSRDSDVA